MYGKCVGPLFAVLLGAWALSGCSTTGSKASGTVISKVKYYHLQNGKVLDAADPMIPFEYKHLMHGAVTTSERREREGNYYTVFWKVDDNAPVTVRMQYRQANTGSTVHTKAVDVSKPKGRNATRFQVTGSEYQENGKVTAWKANLIRGGQSIAGSQSFLWQ